MQVGTSGRLYAMLASMGKMMRASTRCLLAFSAVVTGVMLVGCGNSHPSDEDILRIFRGREGAFSNVVVRLREMPNIERFEWTGSSLSVDSSRDVPPAAKNAWNELMLEIGLPCTVMSMGGGKQVCFVLSVRGIAVSGSSKGLVYQEHVPDHLVQDTDSEARAYRPFSVFKRLDSKWYIFYSQ